MREGEGQGTRMDERTADSLREVVEDMAQALQLATKNGEALIVFLEDMLSSLESWAAHYNVTVDSKPAIALHSHHHHPLHLYSQRSPTELASPLHQDLDAKQAFAYTESEVEHLGKGVASVLCPAQVLSRCAHDVIFDGKSSVGIFCFDAECEKAWMQAAEKRHDNHMGMYGRAYKEGQAQMQLVEGGRHVETQKDMHLCGKRAKTSSAGAGMELVKEERCEHETMAFLGGAGAFHIDPHTDNAVRRPDITPSLVHSSLHAHRIGMHAYKPAPESFELAMPLQAGKREPCASEQKGKEIGSDWLQEGSSM